MKTRYMSIIGQMVFLFVVLFWVFAHRGGDRAMAEELNLPWTVESVRKALTVGTVLVYTEKGTDSFGDPVDRHYSYEITQADESGIDYSSRGTHPEDPTETLGGGGAGSHKWEDDEPISPFFVPGLVAEITLLRSEQVTVPAGTFDCVVVELTGEFFGKSNTVWMIPDKPGVYAKVVEEDLVYELVGIRQASPRIEPPETLLQNIETLTQTLSQHPQDAEAYYQRGESYLKLEKYEEAIQDYTKVIELAPQDARGYRARGLAYAEFAYADKAIADYQHALELDPNNAVTYQYWGRVLTQVRKYDEAFQKFQKALDLDPNNGMAYFERGYAYMRSGQYEDAIQEYTQCLKRLPDYFRAWYYRGSVHAELQQYDDAIWDYFRAVLLKNEGKYGKPVELEMVEYELSTLYQQRGKISYKAEKYKEALNDFKNAIEYYADDASSYYWRAESYRKLGYYSEAIQDYDAAITRDPDMADAYFYRGLSYELSENYTQAIQDYSKYTEFDPEEPATYKFRGDCYRMLAQYAEAIQDYDAAIARDPEYARAYYDRGLTHEKSGQNEQAANDYNVYLKLRGAEDENADKIRQRIRELGYTPQF